MVVVLLTLSAVVFIVAVIVDLRWGMPAISDDLNMSEPADLAFTLGFISVIAIPLVLGVKLAKSRPVGSLFHWMLNSAGNSCGEQWELVL